MSSTSTAARPATLTASSRARSQPSAGTGADQVRVNGQSKTAKLLGLTIPQSLLATADEVSSRRNVRYWPKADIS